MLPVDVNAYVRSRKLLVDEALGRYLGPAGPKAKRLHDAIRYAIVSDGKRLRPIMTLATAEMLGKRPASVLPAAVAMEMVHTCSLILDDLPCMDDGNIRRRRPSLHRVYGESTAILAAEALLMRAFALLSDNARRARITKAAACDLQHMVAQVAGHDGLVTGQYLDLALRPGRARRASLTYVYRRKTAALFMVSVQVACVLCRSSPAVTRSLTEYARHLGVAFQIVDDLLEACPDSNPGKRSARVHATFPDVVGVGASAAAACSYIRRAKRALLPLGSRARRLSDIADLVRRRIR